MLVVSLQKALRSSHSNWEFKGVEVAYLHRIGHGKLRFFINVIFRAFAYDQERNKNLIIQGNGFLVRDRCTFGVEVFIINSTIPTSAKMSYIDSNHTRAFTWRVKFSKLSDDTYSPEFAIEGRTWKLNVLPRGYGVEKGKCLSLYLNLTQPYDLTAGNKLYAEF
ncbi:hypothetical protein Ancab_028402 [Ancistrocladus abbreviatus]